MRLQDSMRRWQALSGDKANAVAKFFEDIRAKAEASGKAIATQAAKMNSGAAAGENWAKVAAKISDLQNQLHQSAMTDSEKTLDSLKGLGADPASLAKAQDILGQIEKMDTQKKLADKVIDIAEQLKTPFEKYQEQLSELRLMFEKGLLSKEELTGASSIATKAFDGGASSKHADFIQSGSASAQRFMFEQSAGVNSVRNEDVPKKQLKEVEKSNDWLQTIARSVTSTKDIRVSVVDDF